MKNKLAKELNLLLKDFYESIGLQKKLNGSETKRALMKLAGECEKAASKYGFDLSLKDENALNTHNEVMLHYVRANRSASEAKFNAKMIVTDYFNATFTR
jgi:hypothetical protein